jgi:CxxC motif-containing protein (DUF1111 family)
MNDRQGSKEGEALLYFLCMFPKKRRINENSKTFVIRTFPLFSSKAYDFEASWLSGIYSSRFNDGDGLYDDVRTSSNQDGGLGPVYAGYSCGSCHRNAGRTKPTLWSEGGSGNYGFSSMWHGGEAEASKNLFKRMSKEDRDALIAFLNSL